MGRLRTFFPKQLINRRSSYNVNNILSIELGTLKDVIIFRKKLSTMKKFILPLLALTIALGSCNMANDDDYKNLSKDMCDCVNKNSKGLSTGMRDAIIKSSADGADMEAMMQEQVMKNPEQGMKDVEAIMQVAEG